MEEEKKFLKYSHKDIWIFKLCFVYLLYRNKGKIMKKTILSLVIIAGLASCEKPQKITNTFEFDSQSYKFGVFQETELGCTGVEDEVIISFNGQMVNLNGATGLLNGENINIINNNNVVSYPQNRLRSRMTEEFNDSAVMEFGSLEVYIVKK